MWQPTLESAERFHRKLRTADTADEIAYENAIIRITAQRKAKRNETLLAILDHGYLRGNK
tara:strand:- start:27 stop:206 length:180 start_codon:yes stop_codon:yes gene_type:complete